MPVERRDTTREEEEEDDDYDDMPALEELDPTPAPVNNVVPENNAAAPPDSLIIVVPEDIEIYVVEDDDFLSAFVGEDFAGFLGITPGTDGGGVHAVQARLTMPGIGVYKGMLMARPGIQGIYLNRSGIRIP